MGVYVVTADARALSAAEYSPYNAAKEAKETPAYKAAESFPVPTGMQSLMIPHPLHCIKQAPMLALSAVFLSCVWVLTRVALCRASRRITMRTCIASKALMCSPLQKPSIHEAQQGQSMKGPLQDFFTPQAEDMLLLADDSPESMHFVMHGGVLQETLSGKGLYTGEAYAPNAPALVDAAARAPAPEGAYLIKEAFNIAPAGVPEVGLPHCTCSRFSSLDYACTGCVSQARTASGAAHSGRPRVCALCILGPWQG